MMTKKFAVISLCIAGVLLVATGCSGTGAAITGGRMGMNLMKKDSHLKVYLDGQKGEQDKLKKAATGYSRFKVKEPVSTAPTLKYEIEDPDKFGRITMVTINIFQKFEADYSHQAEYTIIASDTNNPQAQMKDGVEYNLGGPGAGFKVMDLTNQTVSGIALKPGMKYMLNLSVKADKSETAQVFFETK